MKFLSYLFILVFLITQVQAQQLVLEAPLDSNVSESSGLIYLNNTLITHNDSGGNNELYEIDTSTGNISRTVTISNATNVDWEDLSHDDTYIYIADFGNNQGSRTDLKIYRILITDYFANTSVTADVINFSYSDQTDFTPSSMNTNFDAEALVHYNNNLYIFSKNWIDWQTNIYQLPKTPGNHSISIIDSFDSEGLVTGGIHNTINDNIMLIGYDAEGTFITELSGFSSGLFTNGTITKSSVMVPTGYSFQTEGIATFGETDYYITSEAFFGTASGLFSFNTSTLSNENFDEDDIVFYPNPAKDSIIINEEHSTFKIYAINGQLMKSSTKREINISDLEAGTYLIKIESETNKKITTKKLIIKD
ncbi:MAG: secretion protein [Flavobacteriaceae bacterium]|nr:secretion protein [Flavobacteriaceae bacterium]